MTFLAEKDFRRQETLFGKHRLRILQVSFLNFPNLYHTVFILDPKLFEIVKLKTKNLIWVASNCVHFRRKLVRKLQAHIDIDIFGKCGSSKCSKTECNEMYNTTYKFYLAFENSMCPDYVTEKLFKVLDYNIIPVVLNGANMADFLPPKSYIDANSFKSVKELADYLNFLSNNTEEYMKYFWWKKHYKPHRTRVDLCKICEKINDEQILSQGKTVKNFLKSHSRKMCKRPDIN